MTRISVYSGALVVFVAATAMTITSILIPNWVSYSVTTNTGSRYWKTMGLHRICSSPSLAPSLSTTAPSCRPFPTEILCGGDERFFCSMWRSVGFLASFATILHLAAVVSFLVVLGGGKVKRESGWKILSGLLILVAAIEFAMIGMVAYLYDHDEQFLVPGWYLDSAWYMQTTSAVVAALTSVGLAASRFLLPPEDGYEFLRDPAGSA